MVIAVQNHAKQYYFQILRCVVRLIKSVDAGRGLCALLEQNRIDPDKQKSTSHRRFNSINTQLTVPDCLTIDFVDTTCKVYVALQKELREANP